ncbi:MAG: oligosaccharide flippase family protein [Cyclobacteriaceae bacterium]|nr:oligosaccharide flippase family protein [Cyclobacteriaceae bacterium]
MIFKIAGMLSGYVFIFVALRVTNIEAYGAFTLTLASIQLLSMLGRLGFDLSIVKHVSVFRDGQDGINLIKEVYTRGLKIISISGIIISVLFLHAAILSLLKYSMTRRWPGHSELHPFLLFQ